jgi:hypothetical protein
MKKSEALATTTGVPEAIYSISIKLEWFEFLLVLPQTYRVIKLVVTS